MVMARTKRMRHTYTYMDRRRGINTTKLTDLPPEILVNILKRLHIKPQFDCSTESLCRIQCVCKTLLKVSTEYVAETPLLMRLVECKRADIKNEQTVTALQLLRYDGNVEVKAVEILSVIDSHHYNVDFVFNNLFCFKHLHGDRPCFLINPLGGEILRLPVSTVKPIKEGTISKVFFGMGSDKISDIHKIIRVSRIVYDHNDNRKRVRMVAEVLVLGTRLWREIPYVLPDWNFICMNNVCAYGDMHWLCSGFTEKGIEDICNINFDKGICIIVSFDFTKEVFTLTALPILQSSGMCLHLITLRGSIAIVDTSSDTKIEIWVMKDYNRKQWTLDYTINTLESGFLSNVPFVVCEWEHGILFTEELGDTSFFFDLRRVTRITETGFWQCVRVFTMIGSLISLKDYGNLVDALVLTDLH